MRGVADLDRVLEALVKAVMTLGLSMSIAAVVVAATTFISPEVSYFPGEYFDTEGKLTLQRRAMERWPGPTQIVDRWATGELGHRDKMAILLGASVSHDPVLLPIYLESVTSSNPRIRMAAAYGYRDLLGDGIPNLSAGVDLPAGRQLAGEIAAVMKTLRARSLVEFWLQAALAAEGASMPGWRGVVMRRSPGLCLGAVEKIAVFDDFQFLAVAYRLSERQSTRFGLLRLLEAVTLQSFYSRPTDANAGWGTKDMETAFEAADEFLAGWLDGRCIWDAAVILDASLAAKGAHGVDPWGPDSWDLWLQVLKQGTPGWRMMAARRLYELGGRWSDLSMFQADSEAQIEERDGLVEWYRLLPAHLLNRKDPPKKR